MGRHASDGRETSELAETTVRIPVLRSGGAHRTPLTAVTRNRGKLIGAALAATAVLAVVGELAMPHHAAVHQAGAMEDVVVPANPATTMHDAAAPAQTATETTPLATVAQSAPIATHPATPSTGWTKVTTTSAARPRPTTPRPTTPSGNPVPQPTGTQPPSSEPSTTSSQPSRSPEPPPTTTTEPSGDSNVINKLPVVGPVVGGLLPGN